MSQLLDALVDLIGSDGWSEALTDEELAAARENLAEVVGELIDMPAGPERLALLEQAAQVRVALDGEHARREEVAAQVATREQEILAALTGEGTVETSEPEPPVETAEPEPVVATEARRVAVTRPLRPAAPEELPVQESTARVTLTGQPVTTVPDRRQVAAVLLDTARRHGAVGSVPVVQLTARPGRPVLRATVAPEVNAALVAAALTDEETFAAACAPHTAVYQQPVISVPDRPVRDALLSVEVDRTGVAITPAPTLADITTAATGVFPDPDPSKTVQTVTCPETVQIDLAAVYRRMRFPNLVLRGAPERVAALLDLLAAAHAREAERHLLGQIVAGSTAVTIPAVPGFGADRAVVDAILRVVAAQRRIHRTIAPMTVILPDWFADAASTDRHVSSDPPGMIEDVLTDRGVRVVWSLDYDPGNDPSGTAWPGTVKAILVSRGAWFHADGGTLDAGVIRDSTVNAANQAEMFMETFEAAVRNGGVSTEVTITGVCVSGGAGGTVDPTGVCT